MAFPGNGEREFAEHIAALVQHRVDAARPTAEREMLEPTFDEVLGNDLRHLPIIHLHQWQREPRQRAAQVYDRHLHRGDDV